MKDILLFAAFILFALLGLGFTKRIDRFIDRCVRGPEEEHEKKREDSHKMSRRMVK